MAISPRTNWNLNGHSVMHLKCQTMGGRVDILIISCEIDCHEWT